LNTLGERIHAIRKSKGMTIKEVANITGLTPSFISQLERGITTASIASIQKIAQALGTQLSVLFNEEPAASPPSSLPTVIRKNSRVKLVYPNLPNTVDYILTGRGGKLEVLHSTIEPGGHSGGLYSHDSDEECIVVLRGTMELMVDDKMYHLSEGDSITFCSRQAHGWRNIGQDVLEVIWIITPPTY
jgi:transcriptional regulator with XRE-family HTH domain